MAASNEMIVSMEHPVTFAPISQSTRASGAFYVPQSRASMVSNIRAGEYAFYYAPGWHTDGTVIAKNFDKHMEQFGSTHYGVHPTGTYSLDAQKDAWLQARRKDGYRPAKIYAQSKGALTVSHMFADSSFRHAFGEVDSICLDSPVSSKDDIHRPFYNYMQIGRRLPKLQAVEKISRIAMERMLSDKPDYDSRYVAPNEALENARASTRTRLIACISQLEYMWTHDIADLDLRDFGASIPNKKIISAPSDRLVNLERSSAVIDRSYGGGFEYRIDSSRTAGDHATGTERPEGVIDALMNQCEDRYRIVSIGRHALNGTVCL